ncbi:MAG: oxidative damage protection protein [Deltaproteobacteria bacterium]|nr:oxidative damage protection protein [Deltaproteobacteria bacterium]
MRMVQCSKHGRELPGLEKPPFPGVAGEQIFKNVSAQAWFEWWDGMQIKVLNEYRLNMGNAKDYQILFDEMMRFLKLPEVKVV